MMIMSEQQKYAANLSGMFASLDEADQSSVLPNNKALHCGESCNWCSVFAGVLCVGFLAALPDSNECVVFTQGNFLSECGRSVKAKVLTELMSLCWTTMFQM